MPLGPTQLQCKCIRSSHAWFRSCRSFYLNRNNLSGPGIQAITNAMRFNDNIFRLNLAGNPIGAQGAAALRELLFAQVRAATLH